MAAKGRSQRVTVIGKARALPLTSDAKRFPVIETDADIATGAEFLVAREPCFAKVVEVHGLPSARRVENNLRVMRVHSLGLWLPRIAPNEIENEHRHRQTHFVDARPARAQCVVTGGEVRIHSGVVASRRESRRPLVAA